MALRYGFYNSINHDRKYDALDMSSIFDGVIEDGVFATIGNMFAVKPGEGLQVIVDAGKAWFNHTWTSNDAPLPFDIETADITLDRYDAVVLEINNEQSVRANSIKIVKGVAKSSPEYPELTNTDTVKQYPLAYISVTHGATSFLAKDIDFQVGKEPCPFVTGPLETVPIDALFARWESEFDDWFENVKTNLDGDVAANLQRQIDAVDDKVDSNFKKTLSDSTKAIFELGVDAIPDDAFKAIANSKGTWTLIASYTQAGSYQFTVPKGVSHIGVYMRGGGGAGGLSITSGSNKFGSTGGAAGMCKNMELDVLEDQVIPIVVGKGGARVSTAGYQNNGGSTSFNGIVVEGGEGGQSGSGSQTIPGARGSQGSDALNLTNVGLNRSSFLYGVPNNCSEQLIVESMNKFDPLMSVPYAGGCAYYYGNVSSNSVYQECPPLGDGTKGGSGKNTKSSDGEDAIGPGNGGGALCSSGYFKSGAGADGGVWIYVQGVR